MADSVSGIAEAIAELEGLEKRSLDLEPVLARIAELIEAQTVADLDAAVTPEGQPWASLEKPDHAPLHKTGALAASVYAAPVGRSVEFGATSPYASFQQYGTSTIPARPFVPEVRGGRLVPESLETRIVAMIDSYILTGEID